jgi:hypothetical protein
MFHDKTASPIPISRITFTTPSAKDNQGDGHGTIPSTARVHFHSRIRISSGTTRSHRHSHSQLRHYAHDNQLFDGNQLFDSNSSLSSSPSSSISAPLRSRRGSDGEYNSSESTWPPLGKRIGLLAKKRKEREMIQNERTPLISTQPTPRQHCTPRRFYSEEEEDAFYAAEIDRMFGTFPGRLLNTAVRTLPFSIYAHLITLLSGGHGS